MVKVVNLHTFFKPQEKKEWQGKKITYISFGRQIGENLQKLGLGKEYIGMTSKD